MLSAKKIVIMLDIIAAFWEIWLDIVLSTSFFGAFRANYKIKFTLVIGQKFEIMSDFIGAFWEIWLDMVLCTLFFGAFRAHFRIKIRLVINQNIRDNA